jgi:hypothetical protein
MTIITRVTREWVWTHPDCSITGVQAEDGAWSFYLGTTEEPYKFQATYTTEALALQARQYYFYLRGRIDMYPGDPGKWRVIQDRFNEFMDEHPGDHQLTADGVARVAYLTSSGKSEIHVHVDLDEELDYIERWYTGHWNPDPLVVAGDEPTAEDFPGAALDADLNLVFHDPDPGPEWDAGALLAEAGKVLRDRGALYDGSGKERSMEEIANLFNQIAGHNLTTADGWMFMVCLKLTRFKHARRWHKDSLVDALAYLALLGEASQ